MAEDFTPTIRLSIESVWGENRSPSGTPGELFIDPGGEAEIVRALRAHAVRRLDFHAGALLILRHGNPDAEDDEGRGGLDFDSPAQPTTDDIEQLLLHARKAVDALEALRELAPSAFNDDDDDEPEPDPVPEPTGGAHA